MTQHSFNEIGNTVIEINRLIKIQEASYDDELEVNIWPDFCLQQWHDSESEQHV